MAALQDSVCKSCPHLGQSIFSELQEDQLDGFCSLKYVHHYKREQRIFYEGEPNLGLFILCSGKVKISRSSRFGKRQILGLAGPCGLLEEKDLFLKDQRTVSAVAMEDSVVCFVKREDFLALMKRQPQIAFRLVERLAVELEEAEGRIASLSALDVRRRLAGLLLRLAHRHGTLTSDGPLIEIELTREEIAEMTGTTHETVIRILSGFKKENLIREFQKQILLTNEERLRRIAG